MAFLAASIYAAAILFCVGTTAWIVRAWTRRRYWDKNPERLALHRGRRGAACGCRDWDTDRFAYRHGAWLYRVEIGLVPRSPLYKRLLYVVACYHGRESHMTNTTSEMPRHVAMAYKDAVDNIMFNKKQQWVTTNYALLIYAAVFVVSANFFSRNDMVRALLGFLTFLTFVYHWYLMNIFQETITKFRSRLAWIYGTYFTPNEQDGLRLSLEPRPRRYQAEVWLGLLACSMIGAALTEFYLFSVRN